MSSSAFWLQASKSISDLTKKHAKNILVAGCFGHKKGNDLDIFLVFKEDAREKIQEFLIEFREKIIFQYKKNNKYIVPFRYSITKPFIPYLKPNNISDEDNYTNLPVHFLLFPDIYRLLEWEDHEIIRQIFWDITNDGELWVGNKNDLDYISGFLSERDYIKRKIKYEELLFGAFQDATFDTLEGVIYRAKEQSAYATRYLALDDAQIKYGYNLSEKSDIIDYMNNKNLAGVQLLTNNISSNLIPASILSTYNYWSPKAYHTKPPVIKRLKQLRKFCSFLKSPSFVIEEEKIEENISSLIDAFSIFNCPVEVSYAIKANPIVPVVQIIAELTTGGLCATSYSDISVLRQINIQQDIVNFHCHFPEDELLIEAINKKYRIIVSECTTPHRIIELSNEGLISINHLNIFIRVKPEVVNRTGYQRFGLELFQIKSIIELFKKNSVKVAGFTLHSNTASKDPISWAQSLYQINRAILEIWSDYYSHAPIVNLGGGFASAESLSKIGLTIQDFAKEAQKVFSGIDISGLIIEAGRYIIGDACFFLSKIKGIISSENNHSIKTLAIDAGSNILIPLPSSDFSFFNAKEETLEQEESLYNISDTWSSFGTIGRSIKLKNDYKVGDYIIIGNVGSYTYSMASNSGDGIPPFRLLRKKSPIHSFSSSFHFVQNEDYLESKFYLDKPLLEKIMPRVLDRLTGPKKIRVLDVGCGTGAYLYHMINNKFHHNFNKIEYLGVDVSTRMIQSAKKKWNNRQIKTINASFINGSLSDLDSIINQKDFDLVVGLSLLEYTPDDTAIQQLIQMTRLGGLIHLPINYDAETQFEPTFDRDFEDRIVKYFNSKLIPDPWCGRKLYNKLISSNLSIIDFRVDDWLIIPNKYSDTGLGYSDTEEFFLTQLLKAIEKIDPDDSINETEKNDWLLLRNSQIEKRELSFICRQCSILAQR